MSIGEIFQDGRSFEGEVRRLAQLIWPGRRYAGPVIVDGRERDAVIENDEAIHVIEATSDPRLEKAEKDLKKTSELVSKLRRTHSDLMVKGWFITKDELTADQVTAAKKYERTVVALSFKAFMSKVIDAREYLKFRSTRPFGSVSDPIDSGFAISRDSYVSPFFFAEAEARSLEIADFTQQVLRTGARSALIGDFGAGKSMNLREVFFRAASDFARGRCGRFPVYLNLRAHAGQSSPTEALIREAMSTGYARYDDLVKAWRADLIVLILDGFDELVTPAWSAKASQLREHRAACSKLITEFLAETPKNTPIIISGRLSYFGSVSEMERTLRLPDGYSLYRLNDFTKDQAATYLSRIKVGGTVPDWLPPRPLLLGYLVALAQKTEMDLPLEDFDPAVGWDHLFDRICERETLIHTGLFKEYVRRVLERIGTKARYLPDTTQGISQQDISAAFTEIFGKSPDESSLGMLLRLPGLVAVDGQSEDRRFVDHDFAGVAAAGDVFEFVSAPNASDSSCFEQCATNVSLLGAEFITSKLDRLGRPQTMIAVALEGLGDDSRYSTLKGDLLITLASSNAERRSNWISVTQALIGTLDLREAPDVFSNMKIFDSIVDVVEVDEGNLGNFPEFMSSQIGIVRGPRDDTSISKYLRETTVDRFDFEPMTNNSIQELSLPGGVKVGLTALRKLYMQTGGGRREGAFSRGIRPELRKLVAPVLETLVSHGFAAISNRSGDRIYLKRSACFAEAREIVAKNGVGNHPLLQELRQLS